MSPWEESTTWIAVAASLAGVFLILVLVLALRLRAVRKAVAADDELQGASGRTQLMSALERAQEGSERIRTELRWHRHLREIGATVELEAVLRRALEAATKLATAAAGMVVLARGDDDPLVASFGLSPAESSGELLGVPPAGGGARAVSLAYRYSEDELELDEFRLRTGLALPVLGEGGESMGTLAIFWRRSGREVGEEELSRLEALTRALAPALANAHRFDELRRVADLDPVTGLHKRRYLHEALARECSRARRYERRLSLVLLRVDVPPTEEALAATGGRLASAVRGADLVCHLGGGRFAVLLPEASLSDAERLHRRLQLAVDSVGDKGPVGLSAGIVELRPEDDADSVLGRAEASLARDEEPGGPGTGARAEPAA